MKVPDRLQRQYVKQKERAERFLRDFEWSWTTAVLFSLALAFFSVITMAVIPSFWLYFAEQKLNWDGLSGTSDWRPLARDAVAAGLATGPFFTVIVLAAIVQNWRRKLRGASGERASGGYR
jgi:ABC-type Fe3+ transport system permease subunit